MGTCKYRMRARTVYSEQSIRRWSSVPNNPSGPDFTATRHVYLSPPQTIGERRE